MNHPTNAEFLAALFGEDAPWVHVTDFTYDPGNIPKGKHHLIAWKGDYFCRYRFSPVSNQYFTISNFYADQQGQARRRKILFRHTRVIVLDDVKEKLSLAAVHRLPQPAWVLETSPGSEQWGYILDQPCTDRSMVENLLDGLVANGLAPDGKDPGMKGVTRYVRLPDGYNNKASKLVNGQPFKCRITHWAPANRVTIQQLAEPFAVNLYAQRREGRLDGAAAIDDHPLLNVPDLIDIKEMRSDGRFDVTCPWVDEHTHADDSGAGVFTNADGTIGFKCHHGSCQHRTGQHLLRFIESELPGFGASFNNWKVTRALSSLVPAQPVSFLQPASKPDISFMAPATISFIGSSAPAVPPVPALPTGVPMVPSAPAPVNPIDGLQLMADALRRERPTSQEARNIAAQLLKFADELPKIDQKHWHDQVCDLMTWSKSDLKDIITDLRRQWYGEKVSKSDFYDDVLYVKELNQFYDWKSRIFFSTDAFQNSFSHEDMEAKKIALQDGRVKKVDRLDYAPGMPRIFQEDGINYGNTYTADDNGIGVPGAVDAWFNHFDVIGWSEHRKHVLQWMAFTLRHPERKINHMLLLGSGEGAGKDFILYPLLKGMNNNSVVISGEELLDGFNDYLLYTKYVHINETELGDRKEATAISNKLKPLAAAPPEKLRVNQKNVKKIQVRNIVNGTMTTNSELPIRLNGPSRRFYAMWSEFTPRDAADNMKPEWQAYWQRNWEWMTGDGWKACVYYLRYCVDLSDFNPGAAPPVTEFLREIREASRSPAAQTLESFIRREIGLFKSDLLSNEDMIEVVRSVAKLYPDDFFCDPRYFTKTRTGQAMSELSGVAKLRAYNMGENVRLWAVRNSEKYLNLDSQSLFAEYRRQLNLARTTPHLQVVK